MESKPALKALRPYTVKNLEYTVKLDANESTNYLFKDGIVLDTNALNLYPDSNALSLREKLSEFTNVPIENLMVGSGSSELIELIIKTYVAPGETVLSFNPSFTMYEVYTTIHNGKFVSIPVEDHSTFNIDQLIDKAQTIHPKLIIVCTPNNPTGYKTPKEDILKLIQNTSSLILLDEAYMDFADENSSFLHLARQYKNVIVARTFSKAFGLAGARLGYISTALPILQSLSQVKTPYSVSTLTQTIAIEALSKKRLVQQHIIGIIKRRRDLQYQLNNLGFTVYPSQTNFLFVSTPVKNLGEELIKKGVLIRDFASYQTGFYRITVGTETENAKLVKTLKEILS